MIHSDYGTFFPKPAAEVYEDAHDPERDTWHDPETDAKGYSPQNFFRSLVARGYLNEADPEAEAATDDESDS